MPVINFKYSDLCDLLGEKVPQETLVERIPLIGADMHDTEGGNDDMSVEFFPDRPDLFSVEGLARALRAFLNISPGLKTYEISEGTTVAIVDESVMSVRPSFSCAIVRDIKVDDDLIRSMMELQEKLHMTIGRKRSKLAIGIHDLDKVKAPFTYKAVSPNEVKFIPLASTEVLDLDGILKKHPKGVEYANLLRGKKKYPIITDADDNVLSFPPIINGVLTTVTTGSKNLFIDVTGTDEKAVKGALDIVVTSLAERGGRIECVNMKGVVSRVSPDLSSQNASISVKKAEKFIGVNLGTEGVINSLKRMGMDAKADRSDIVKVNISPTRLDIMHEVDIFEDIAIGYGFEKFGGPYTTTQTTGNLGQDTLFSEKIRDVLVGLGFTEVTTLTLSNEREEFEISCLPKVENTTILNPITEDHTCLRSYLMPSLMRILRHNKHRELPQKIFEIGFVALGHSTIPHLCALQTASRTSFTEIKSIAEAIMRESDVKYDIIPCDHKTFIDGRGASIIVNGKEIGVFGEVSPRVITDFEITHPIMMFEVDVSSLITEKAGRLF
jgi:phenylalanyl-tRNA synthetase, beta subunit